MLRLRLASTALLLASTAALGQEDPICEMPDHAPLAEDSVLRQLESLDPESVEFLAGEVEASFGPGGGARMSGGVFVRRGDRLAGAESAIFDPDSRALLLRGEVRYEDPSNYVVGDSAEFAYDSGRIRFDGAEFRLGGGQSRGAADSLEISREGTLELDDVSYTTCPPGSDDWLLEAGDIDIDTERRVGTAQNVKLRFKGVPILYSPFLSFPIGDARKTGFLTPELGSAGRSGNEIRAPFYWNIAENYDATLTPRLLTDRGLQVGSEFRYLTRRNEGMAQFDYLPDDSLTGTNRHLTAVQHQTIFDNGWRNRIDFREVSDSGYFEDLGGSLSVSSITHLDRSIWFDYYGDRWSLFARIQDYQTIDDTLLPTEKPYRRLPQFVFNGTWPDRILGLQYDLDGELVYFDRDVGVTGWRADVAPRVSWPLERPGWFVVPEVSVEYTAYGLGNTEADQPNDPDRLLPIASLDTGMILERRMEGSEGHIQTLEPRILYVHVPHRNQDDLPVFDTIVPDLNLVQLYRKNRFLGVDRIGDTDQLSIGITSRVLDGSSGEELVSATIGQALYLSEQGVQLPGQPVAVSESSDYIAELSFLVFENLNFDIGHQWGTGDNGTTQSQARVQYRPRPNKILNLGYRFRRGSLEQGDISWSWPLSRRWNFVGRYNFSFRDNEPLERFFGIEYESCCWGIRVVTRRHVSTRDGTQDSSFGLQLVLKGMTSVGTAADQLLERGILGYTPDIE
ncbi:MAG TPA: LPS assembly protein LptD [Woeseiaceae bacterium]|nr:LPS assembly protein LptD [Woeseiaceae bacterium]